MSHVERVEAAGAWWSVCVYGAALMIVLLLALLWPRLVAEHRRRLARVAADRGGRLRLRPRWMVLRDSYAPCERTRYLIDPSLPEPTRDYPGGPLYRPRSDE